ncbi:MAG: hypothetical protein KDC54_16860, partial [Lewinella sp.]|nr:hypothetical protein [Lewinella sp.]
MLQLSLWHDFHTDGRASELKLHPTSATAALMRRLDIRIVERGGQYAFFYGQSTEEGVPPASLWNAGFPLLLNFGLIPESPNFSAYSDLPLSAEVEQRYFFTNQRPGSGEDSLTLSVAAEVGAGDLVQSFPAIHSVALPAVRPLTVQVTNAAGQLVMQDSITGQAQDNQPYLLDLRNEDGGRYDMAITGEDQPSAEETRYLLQPNGLPPNCWGFIQLVLSDPFLDEAATPEREAPDYHLRFKSRATIWRYHLVNQNGLEYDDLKIVENRTPVPLAEVTESQLGDGV